MCQRYLQVRTTVLLNFESIPLGKVWTPLSNRCWLDNITTVLSVPDIGLAVRVFANGPGDLGSIPGRVIPKTQKMVNDASLLNTQHYKVRIKGKVAPSPTPWCCSYRKGSLRVTLDYGRQLYFTLLLSYEDRFGIK